MDNPVHVFVYGLSESDYDLWDNARSVVYPERNLMSIKSARLFRLLNIKSGSKVTPELRNTLTMLAGPHGPTIAKVIEIRNKEGE